MSPRTRVTSGWEYGWEYNLLHHHQVRSENETETRRRSQIFPEALCCHFKESSKFTEKQTGRHDYDRERVHSNKRLCYISRLPGGVPEEDVQSSQRAGAVMASDTLEDIRSIN